MKNKKLALTGAVSNLVGIVAKKGLAILISIILIRELSIREFGEFNLFVATISLTATIALGVDKIIQRFFPLYISRQHSDKPVAVALLVVFAIQRYFVFCLLILIGYLFVESGWVDVERFNFRYIGLAIAVGIVLATRLMAVLALNAAYMEHKLVNAAYVSGDLLKLVAMFFWWEGVLRDAVIIWGAGEVIVLLLIAFRLRARLQPLPNIGDVVRGAGRIDYSRCYSYGKYMMFASTGSYVLSSEIDYFFLSYFHDTEAVGMYAFAVKIPLLLLALAPSHLMFNVTMPLLFRKLDSGAHVDEVKPAMVTFLKLSAIGWTVMATICAVNLQPIIHYIFDPKYEHSIVYIYAWFIILYPLVFKNVFEPIARALEYARVYLFTVLAGIVNVVGNILLIPTYGVDGAIIATGLSVSLQGLSITYYVCRRIDLKFHYVLLRRSAEIAIAWGCVLIVNSMLETDLGGRMLANFLLIVVLLGVFWPTRWFSSGELSYIKSFISAKPNESS